MRLTMELFYAVYYSWNHGWSLSNLVKRNVDGYEEEKKKPMNSLLYTYLVLRKRGRVRGRELMMLKHLHSCLGHWVAVFVCMKLLLWCSFFLIKHRIQLALVKCFPRKTRNEKLWCKNISEFVGAIWKTNDTHSKNCTQIQWIISETMHTKPNRHCRHWAVTVHMHANKYMPPTIILKGIYHNLYSLCLLLLFRSTKIEIEYINV